MPDALTLIKRYVQRLEERREEERAKAAENFAREVFIHAPSYLYGILPPEFFVETSFGTRFKTEYVDVEPKGPNVARLVLKGVSNGVELLVARTVYATYMLYTWLECPICGERFIKEIKNPKELLTILEGRVENLHECRLKTEVIG